MPLGTPTSAAVAGINSLEKYLETLTGAFGTVARKEAGVRDAYDDVARANIEFVRGPHMHNPSTKNALESFSKCVVATQDYRHAKLSQIESSLLPLLYKLHLECKQAKTFKTKGSFGSEQKLSSGTKQDDHNQQKSGSLDALAQAKRNESELVNFERVKLQQLKKAITEALVLDLAFHSRAIEQLSPVLTALHNIDIESDLQEFCKSGLGITSGAPAVARSESVRSSQQRSSTSSAGNKANLGSSGPVTLPSSKQPQGKAQAPPEVKVSSEFDDEGDEDEYEEEEEGDTTESGAMPWPATNRTTTGANRQMASSGRPLTGAQGPPVPERTPSQRMPNASLFLGSSK